MGFSVSGSAALVFVGVLVAGSIIYPTIANGVDQIQSAQNEYNQDVKMMRDTDITIRTASYNETNTTLSIVVANTGATTLTVNNTDVLVNNTYITSFQLREVDSSNPDSDLWLPHETLRIEIDFENRNWQPDRVKIATRFGIQDVAVVS